MTDDEKIAAKVKFAICAARTSIQAASDAAHELKFADEDEADFKRDMELAWVVKRIHFLCPPNLHVLNEIINVLVDIEEHEHEPASISQASH
jgi:hypothetical protein